MKTNRSRRRNTTTDWGLTEKSLRSSGALLDASIGLDSAIERHVLSVVGLDRSMADLLTRLTLAPKNRLRGIDISRQLAINPSRTSRLIDRAEEAGLVTRLPDPEDRRAQLITFTDNGRRAVERFAPHLLDVLDEVIRKTFTAEEHETLVALLLRLAEAARTLADSELKR